MAKKPHFIREWRKYRGLTLEQLAERIGMTHQNLGKIERFLVPYSQPLLERLAAELRTDEGSLVMRDPSEPDAIWSIWDSLAPTERDTATRMLQGLKKTAPEPASNVQPLRRARKR